MKVYADPLGEEKIWIEVPAGISTDEVLDEHFDEALEAIQAVIARQFQRMLDRQMFGLPPQ